MKLLGCLLLSLGAFAGQAAAETVSSGGTPLPPTRPVVIGGAQGTFSIGELLHEVSFNDPAAWQLQIQKSDAASSEKVVFKDGVMDLYMPERGCTAWFRQKLAGSITIVYRVRCPLETLADPGIQARDINNFWHAADSGGADGVLDATRYNGAFGSYDKMLGYYASTGGGGRIGNQTTRLRRYPREAAGVAVPHIALTSRDGQKEFLITPGKWHTVQLVAHQGFLQYIVDGVLVYEISPGSPVSVEVPAGDKTTAVTKPYRLDEFPAYTSGYFGLRLVGTHHQYADLKIYRLNPVAMP